MKDKSHLDNFLRLLSMCDYYARPISLTFKNQSSFRTPFGGCLSICCFSVIIALTYSSFENLVDHKNANVTNSEFLLSRNPIYDLNSTSFFFGLRLENAQGEVIKLEPRLFEFIMYYDVFARDDSGIMKDKYTEEQILRDCSLSDIRDPKVFHQNNIGSFSCQDFGNKNYPIGGQWTDTIVIDLSYSFKRCDKSTEIRNNITCATDIEFNNFFSRDRYYLGMLYSTYNIDPNNYSNFSTIAVDYAFSHIDPKYTKTFNFKVENNQMRSDSGLIQQDLTNTNILRIEKSDMDFGEFKYDSNSYGNINFITSRKIKNILRVYQRLQDIFSNIGGFFQLLSFMVSFIYYITRDLEYKNLLWNEILEFRINTNENEQKL